MVQARVAATGDTDLELRRVRSELAALERQLSHGSDPRTDALTNQALAQPSDSAASKAAGKAAGKADQPVHRQLFDRPEEIDDLQKIKGIGPVMQSVLNELGVTTFRQIAQFSAEDVARVAIEINSFPDRIERDDWICLLYTSPSPRDRG